MRTNPLRQVGRKLNGLILEGLRYHTGSVVANRLGYQVVRAASKNAAWGIRSRSLAKDMQPHADVLDRDGIVVIPDFLPAEIFRQLREEYERSRGHVSYDRQVVEDNSVVEEFLDIDKQPDSFPTMRAHLQQNPRMRHLASAGIRRRLRDQPQVSVRVWRKTEGVSAGNRLVGSNYIHADVHYPTIKMWLYLNDIDENNGAFMYARGSHKMTLARLSYEYDASVRVARAKREGALYATAPYGLTRAPSPEQIAKMGIREESICGRANTLVAANTQGFHRQGEFQPGTVREKVLIDFRNAEAAWYFRLRRSLGHPIQ